MNKTGTKAVTGIILAGGESSRMGMDKALVTWKNQSLIHWVYKALEPLCADILVSYNGHSNKLRGYTTIRDRYRGIGPMAGLEAGLRNSINEINLFVSCDTPNLPSGLFAYMIEKHGTYEVSILGHDDAIEPMIGIYNKSLVPRIEQAINNGNNNPPQFIKSCNWQLINIHQQLNFYLPEMFLNLNSPNDLK